MKKNSSIASELNDFSETSDGKKIYNVSTFRVHENIELFMMFLIPSFFRFRSHALLV